MEDERNRSGEIPTREGSRPFPVRIKQKAEPHAPAPDGSAAPPAQPSGLRLRTLPGTRPACEIPTALPPGGVFLEFPLVVALTASTPGAAIEYQVKDVGETATASWTAYVAPVSVPGDRTLYARATKAGLSDSAVLQEDYRHDPENLLPPGWRQS